MQTNIKSLSFKSANDTDTISAVVYYPEGEPVRAVLQICHGMYEHIGRYHEFMLHLASCGFAVFGHDHLGHGKSVCDPSRRGYFAPKNGYQCLLRDAHHLTQIAAKMFPERRIFLLGHSMGSLVARLYCMKYPEELAGALFLGTPGPNALTGAGAALAQHYIKKEGPFFRPPLLEKLTIDNFNRRFAPTRTHRDWISRDESFVDRAIADPLSSFVFTASAFADLYAMMELANSSKWAREYPKELPTLILSGDCDAVGNFGRGVLSVYNRLLSCGVLDLTFELYAGARHELLNEENRQEVIADILDWLQMRL